MKEQIKAASAIILVAALAYVIWAQISGRALLPGGAAASETSEPDTSQVANLRGVASVAEAPVLGEGEPYDLGGRNLFQYGPPKPPPPSAAELEAMRKAEEARLKAMEEEARRRAEEQRQAQEEMERRAREAQEALQKQRQAEPQAPPKPSERPKPPPPPINLKLVGYLGPQRARIAVFLSGKDVVLGRKGDVIDGKFKVLSMGPESVEMGYVDPTHEGVSKRIDLGS